MAACKRIFLFKSALTLFLVLLFFSQPISSAELNNLRNAIHLSEPDKSNELLNTEMIPNLLGDKPWGKVTTSDANSINKELLQVTVRNSSESSSKTDYTDFNMVTEVNPFIKGTSIFNKISPESTIIEPGSIDYINVSTQVDAGIPEPNATIDKPIDTEDGDFMIAFLSSSVGGSSLGSNISAIPSGWIEEFDFINTATNGQHTYVYWKFAGSSEPLNYTWDWMADSAWIGYIVTLRGVNNTSPIHITSSTNSGTSTDPISASITTSEENVAVLTYFVNDKNVVNGTADPPFGTTLLALNSSATNGGNGMGSGLAIYNQSMVGATGPKSWIGALTAADEWTGWQIGLLPKLNITNYAPPQITEIPNDQTITENSNNNLFNWTATSLFPNTYLVYVNGSIEEIGTWQSNVSNSINSDGISLNIGINNITVIVQDDLGDSSNFTFYIEVADITSPKIITSTDNFEMVVGSSGNILEWLFNDLHPKDYSIYIEGQLQETKSWFNAGILELNIDNLKLGTHNITIIAYDTSANYIVHTVIVNVIFIGTQSPELSLETKFYQGYEDNVTGVWKDDNDIPVNLGQVSILLNGSVEKSDVIVEGIIDFSMNYNYAPGNYNLTIIFNKQGYQNHTLFYSIIIYPHELSVEVSYGDLVRGEDFTIEITVNYLDPDQNSLALSAIGGKSGVAENIPITIKISLDFENNTRGILNLEGVTNNMGYVILTLRATITMTVVAVSSIEVEVLPTVNALGGRQVIPDSELPLITTIDELNRGLGENDDLFGKLGLTQEHLILIIATLLTVIILNVLFRVIRRFRKTTGKAALLEKLGKDSNVLFRLREIHSINALLIIDYTTRRPVFLVNYSKEDYIEDVISQITSSYTDLDTVENVNEFIINSMDRSIDELIPYNFINIERILGDNIDVYLISHGETPEISKSLKIFHNWINQVFELDRVRNLKDVFDSNKETIEQQLHLIFDTWALHDLFLSENIKIANIKDNRTREVLQYIQSTNGLSFLDLVNKLQDRMSITEIYNIVHQALNESVLIQYRDSSKSVLTMETPVLFMVIQTLTGGNITSCHFGTKEINEVLLSGLISAIQSMSQSIFETTGVIENIDYDEYTIAFRFKDEIMYSYVFAGPSFSIQKKFDKFFSRLTNFRWLLDLSDSLVVQTTKSQVEALNSLVFEIFNQNDI